MSSPAPIVFGEYPLVSLPDSIIMNCGTVAVLILIIMDKAVFFGLCDKYVARPISVKFVDGSIVSETKVRTMDEADRWIEEHIREAGRLRITDTEISVVISTPDGETEMTWRD